MVFAMAFCYSSAENSSPSMLRISSIAKEDYEPDEFFSD